jgi:hypothetical protein
MNYLIIILAIIVIFLIYYIYTKLTAVQTIGNNIDLTQPPVEIKSSTISNPYSSNYSIGVWIYIDNYSQNSQIGRFLMYGNTTNSGENSLFSLRMDDYKPILYCDVLVNSATSIYSKQTVQLNTESESFPVQKWVYVVVSVSYAFIECYMNGRFVSATKVNEQGLYVSTAPAGADKNSGPTFKFGAKGTSMDNGIIRKNGCPIVLTGLSRWDTPLSSGDIYNNYSKGNGNKASIFGPPYHMDLNLKQDKNNYTFPVF